MSGERCFVKICGVTSAADARLCVDEGVDAIGLNFWPGSRRRVDLSAAEEIARAAFGVLRVGLFVNAPVEEIERVVARGLVDVVQLHGGEPPGFGAGLALPRWKAVSPANERDLDDALAHVSPAGGAALLVCDAAPAGIWGGAGQVGPWDVAARLAAQTRILLAGGLHPDNVGRAVAAVRPFGVDVASGVESAPGRKEPSRVRAFVRAAREAER